MAYTPTTWTNGSGQPVSAENLNKIEAGIAAAAGGWTLIEEQGIADYRNDKLGNNPPSTAIAGGWFFEGLGALPYDEYRFTFEYQTSTNDIESGSGWGFDFDQDMEAANPSNTSAFDYKYWGTMQLGGALTFYQGTQSYSFGVGADKVWTISVDATIRKMYEGPSSTFMAQVSAICKSWDGVSTIPTFSGYLDTYASYPAARTDNKLENLTWWPLIKKTTGNTFDIAADTLSCTVRLYGQQL